MLIAVFALPVPTAVGDGPDMFAQGVRLFNQGLYEQATASLAAAVNERPDDPARRLTYGVALANSRRYDEAIRQFLEVTKLVPDDPVAYLLLEAAYAGQGASAKAQAARRQADLQLARRFKAGAAGAVRPGDRVPAAGKPAYRSVVLDRALAAHKENAIAYNLLGDLNQVQGRYQDAIGFYRQATALAPGWVKPWFNLGMANLTIDPVEAAADFNRVLQVDPGNLQAQLWLGDAYAEQRNYGMALNAYNQAMNSRALEPVARSRAGNVYLKQNQAEKAEEEFRRASKAAPQDPVPAAGLADALQKQQKLDESSREYERALTLTQEAPSQQAAILPNLASNYAQKGDYTRAIDEMKRAIALDPTQTGLVSDLADAYQRAGLLLQGIREYQAVLRKNPGDTVAMRFLLRAYAICGEQRGRAQMAKKLVKAMPDQSATWYRELGAAHSALGDRQSALDAWRRGLEAIPGPDPAGILPQAQAAGMIDALTAHYEKDSRNRRIAPPSLVLAGIYEFRGNFQAAAEERRRLTRLFPEQQHYWILLGDALTRVGDRSGARDAYTRAAGMKDDPRLRDAALQRLGALQ